MNYEDVVHCARFAKKNKGTGPLSTGESLAAALVLNKPEWLKRMGYTIAEALNRVDDDGSGEVHKHILRAQRLLASEG